MAITLELPPELESRLDTLVRDTGRPREDYLVMALEEYLEDMEDYNDAVRISGLIERGEMKTWTAEEVRKDLELDD